MMTFGKHSLTDIFIRRHSPWMPGSSAGMTEKIMPTILVTGFGPFPGCAVQSDRAAGATAGAADGGRVWRT